MALFQKTEADTAARENARFAEMKDYGRIVARIIDDQSGLQVLDGIYAVRMLDEGERRLFMNDYTPTIGKVMGDVVFLSRQGERVYKGIRGFYKMQHNVFTLLVEGRLKEEQK